MGASMGTRVEGGLVPIPFPNLRANSGRSPMRSIDTLLGRRYMGSANTTYGLSHSLPRVVSVQLAPPDSPYVAIPHTTPVPSSIVSTDALKHIP